MAVNNWRLGDTKLAKALENDKNKRDAHRHRGNCDAEDVYVKKDGRTVKKNIDHYSN